jgi:NAD+ kinase
MNYENRPVSVTADNKEFRDVKNVEVYSSNKNSCKLLFDNNHSIEERILKEQFYS